MKLLSSVLPAQESYACDVEGVDADFLLLMAGVVKSGVCSKARYGMGVGTLLLLLLKGSMRDAKANI